MNASAGIGIGVAVVGVAAVVVWVLIDLYLMEEHRKEWWDWHRNGYLRGKPEPVYHHLWPLHRVRL